MFFWLSFSRRWARWSQGSGRFHIFQTGVVTCWFFKWAHHSIKHSSFFLFFNPEMRTVIQNTEQPLNLAPLTSTLSTSFPGWTSQESCFRELRSPSAVEMLFPCKNPPVLSLLLSSSWEASHLRKLWKAIDKRKGMTFASGSFTQRYAPGSQRKIWAVVSMRDLWKECRKRILTG